MRVLYRGFEIDCHREKCMAGYPLLYFTVYRKSDGYELVCNYTEGSDTVRDYVKYMKDRVDGFIKDPSEEVLQEDHMDETAYIQLLADHQRENEITEKLHAR